MQFLFRGFHFTFEHFFYAFIISSGIQSIFYLFNKRNLGYKVCAVIVVSFFFKKRVMNTVILFITLSNIIDYYSASEIFATIWANPSLIGVSGRPSTFSKSSLSTSSVPSRMPFWISTTIGIRKSGTPAFFMISR